MQIIVIGGGISGLACAYRLRRGGLPVLLLEESERVGGVIHSVRQDGFLFELGPQSFLSTETLLELIESLGMTPELQRADSRAPRYVLAGSRLHKVPMAPPALLTTSLLSAGAKLRLLGEPFRKSAPPDGDESIADFVRRKFTADLLDNLVGPFVSGVYAGDPEKLSLPSAFPSIHQWEKEYGSVLRGAMKSRPPKDKPRPGLCSFREGVAALPRALGNALGDALRCGAYVNAIRRGNVNGTQRFAIGFTHAGRSETLSADAVVLAVPTPIAAQLLAREDARFAENFARIEYAPVAVVAAGYRRDQVAVPADGFGFLVSRREKRRVLGTVWSSSLFPGRAPEGMVAFTSFGGGATDPALCRMSEDEIADAVLAEVSEVMKISGPPVTRRVQCYDRALPQYNLGHAKILASLRQLCAGVPGLFLTGNYWEGPAMGACVEHAFRTADAVRGYCGSAPDETTRAQSAGVAPSPR